MVTKRPYFSSVGLMLSISAWVVNTTTLREWSISAQGLAAAALVLSYIGYLRKEHYAIACAAGVLAAGLLLITNWVALAVLLIIPIVRYLKFVPATDIPSESFFGLFACAAILAFLPSIGIPLMWVIVLTAIFYICSDFLGDLFS